MTEIIKINEFIGYNPIKVEDEDIQEMDISYDSNNGEGYNHPSVGSIVVDTTSTFGFDNLAGVYSTVCDMEATVKVRKIAEDYTHYDVDKCRDGGAYGYDFYEIVEVISAEEM